MSESPETAILDEENKEEQNLVDSAKANAQGEGAKEMI
jgi:hypothetical protein